MHAPAKPRLSRPVRIGVVADLQCVGSQQRYSIDRIPIDTVARVLRAEPIIVPPVEDALGIDLARVDGMFMPGGISNIQPARYGQEAGNDDGPSDEARDGFVLPLIPQILARGMQELNVALGGTLRKEPHDLPEEEKHGTPRSAKSENERYRLRHDLNIRKGGLLWEAVNKETVLINSLHSQLIDHLAPELDVEATADDGTIEAARPRNTSGFALGVMFHPEYWAENDATSAAILSAFGEAVRAYADARRLTEAAR
jgi:putative glutamine amidotransferase